MSDLSRRAICRVGGTALGASLAGCLGREPRGRSESGGSPVPTYKYDNARSGATETTPPGKAAEEQWAIESEFTNAFSMAGAAVSETTLYAGIGTFGHAPGGIIALATDTGEHRWEVQPGGTPPTLVDGSLYLGSETIRSVDTETGDSDWSADVDRHVGTPAVADNRIFAAGPERAYGLSTTDGSEHWQYAHEANRGTIPAYADGTVYLGLAAPGTGTSRNGLLALDATDGTERWQTETEGVVVAPAVVDGTVYAATLDGSVLALDAATGESAWHTAPAGRLPQSPGSPSVAHGRVYVRTDSAIYALDTASGEVVWDHSTGKSVVHPPVVVGNQLAVASGGTVSMYDAADGETQYELAVGSERWITGVTITDGTAYLGSSKSGTLTIHALA